MNPQDPNTPVHRFLHWEKTQPEAVFFTEPRPDGSVVDFTWRQVGDQARRMAAHLRSLGLPPGSSIGIVGKNSAHWVMADLAIWMAGHVSVPIYVTIHAENARYILEHCDMRLLFVGKLDGKTDSWNEIRRIVPAELPLVGLPMSPGPLPMHWDTLVESREPLQEVHLPGPGDLATIIYTSGTTGVPKGVMHSFGAMWMYSKLSGEYCSISPRDRMLSYLPLAHAAERAFVETHAICQGLHLYFNDCLETFAADLRRARPTLFISMPRLWTKFYQGVCAKLPLRKQKLLFALPVVSGRAKKKILELLGLDAVRIAFTGSAPLPAEIIAWYRRLGLELRDVYGMTENFCHSHLTQPGRVRLGYCGQPAPGVDVRIGEGGEILMKGATLMLGYYRQPELTAQSMTPDGYFKTGDRGEEDELRRLKITGRVKEIFKTSKGKYVAPAPIENRFAHPKVEAVCVTGPAHPQPFALLLLSADARGQLKDSAAREALLAELDELRNMVNDGLEDHEKLDYVVAVDEAWSVDNGFLTPSFKIRRSVIEDRYLARAQGWAAAGRRVIVEGG
ncbi:AMP-binding protein [Variovorax sp. YR216]|uniref:AMP-binding protein n=1 Tax=Variovorax sp. YR216 TaxID=1882828 RepID=UPI00089605E4|nr:AMP-binding protein [Variovorax sp. YR216]SEB24702.1 Long-chain acyl-CoA synthetase (AMP-forming) [Variovorax sp. YR216]